MMLRVLWALPSVTACDDRPPPPRRCQEQCVLDGPPVPGEQCFDTVVCYYDERNNRWQIVFCEPDIDVVPRP
jgi:hypothetical protein